MNNLQTYVSGFTFETRRREVADAQTRFAEHISRIIGDMTSKMLGVPLGVAVVFAMTQAKGLLGTLLLFVGAVLASCVIHFSVAHHVRQATSIRASKDLVFGALLQRASEPEFPEDLRVALDSAKKDIDSNMSALGETLNFYSWAAWLPTALGGVVLASKLIEVLGRYVNDFIGA